jgi:predicted metalloprotease with PDZ domain
MAGVLGVLGGLGALFLVAVAASAHSDEPRGRLGIQLQPMTPELRTFMKAPEDRGILIVKVSEGSAAAKAGLEVGDVIVALDGEAVDETRPFASSVMQAEKEKPLSLEIVRGGKHRTLSVVPEGEPMTGGPSMFFGRGMHWPSQEMQERIDSMERRLGEIEKRLEIAPPPKPERST